MKEVSPLKKNLLLINKADLLTAEQRETWSSYLTKQGLDFAFFSALEEEEKEAAGKKCGMDEFIIRNLMELSFVYLQKRGL